MATKQFLTTLVCPDEHGISIRVILFEPRKQRGAEIPGNAVVVVPDFDNTTLAVQYAGCRIRRVAFVVDAGIPIVERVGGFLLFVNGVLVAWRSKKQKVVSLSSSEAEFYALAEAVKEIPFVIQILTFLGIPVEDPSYCIRGQHWSYLYEREPEQLLKDSSYVDEIFLCDGFTE